ncbi:MAG TPA: (4Fe-4S)-binding protein [Amycolatopsis sp.]|uniref:ferredoxin n=1 Tax=Amycolatopsis sp. TaxID=37632 RepID=UPI002B47872B|nr:(4Fe-4S)-binding protein [Amycolatopsis sp.]HKS49524.1 (4Fe-4S)-binding protein [Amycolatopsis sp.]
MRIVADTDVCVGAGQCVLTDPEVFDQSEDDGTVIVLVEHPKDLGKAEEAVRICPSGALSLVED